jgi:hypothetical protein
MNTEQTRTIVFVSKLDISSFFSREKYDLLCCQLKTSLICRHKYLEPEKQSRFQLSVNLTLIINVRANVRLRHS